MAIDFDKLAVLFSRLMDLPDFCGIDMVNVNQLSNFGNTPIGVFAVKGDVDAIRVLIEAGADVNHHGDGGYTPLHEAVEQGHAGVVRLLLQNGANPDAVNEDGITPIKLAEIWGNFEISQILETALQAPK